MRTRYPLVAIPIVAIALLVTGCTQTRIKYFSADVAEAPEIHGPSTYIKPHTTAVRISGSLNIAPEEKVDVDAQHTDWETKENREGSHFELSNFSSRGIYNLGGFDVTGSLDFFVKADNVLLGLGIAINDGIYHHLALGINTRYFDFGAFAGLYHHHGKITYTGTECTTLSDCDDGEEIRGSNTDYRISFLYGLYAGLIMGDASLNYSLSSYTPNIDAHGEGLLVPSIYSHYLILGYRLNSYIEIGGGVVGTYIDDVGHWHWGGKTEVSFYWL